MNIDAFLDDLIHTALNAGKVILDIYHSDDFSIEHKEDDSPLTRADKAANAVITEYLNTTGLNILSEEGRHATYEERKQWDYFWMVDPLDGTKEFIKRNGEFTVNIALIHQGKSIFGIVYAPVLNKLFYGGESIDVNLVENGGTRVLARQQHQNDPVRIIASRSHLNEHTKNYIEQFPNAEIVSMGSSLKFMLMAEGKADKYPRFAPTMEWDTAAAQAIVEKLGYKVTDQETNRPLRYNKENLLNPYFLVS